MICLRAEVVDEDSLNRTMFPFASPRNSSSYGGFTLPIDLSGSINRYLFRNGKRSRQRSQSFSSTDGCSTASDLEDKGSGQENGLGGNMYIYRNQLEQDVKILQKRLQEEINLHLTLANAIEHCDAASSYSSSELPDKARELLDGVTLLEITVAKLEQELAALKHQLCQERSKRHLAEYHLRHSPSKASSTHSLSPTSCTEWTVSPCREEEGDQKPWIMNSQEDVIQRLYQDPGVEHLWRHPNELSEEMVLCMRDIFVFLSASSKSSSSETMASLSPSPSHTMYNAPLYASDSPVKASPRSSPLAGLSDSNRVHDQLFHVGAYSMAVEVTSLFVGKKELYYAAGALKKFRLLVEQLAKVDPADLSNNEKLSFWINLYNALIMHAYLAYGIPKNDVKYFSLMQKVAYTVGGHSISAAEIEFIILKMKPPAHHPIALSLALHKFKESGQRQLYSIDQPEPLIAFALSYGMHSSPAVRIFKPESVAHMLKESLQDYVQANVGISNKGKILIPKPLLSFAKSIVQEGSLPEWICQFLPAEQADMIRDCCSSKHKRRLFAPQSFTVLPFSSSFRYLFLMEYQKPSW